MSNSPPEKVEETDVDFENVERNFQNVINDIVNDRSLDKFRTEYENLHEALIISHDHNKALVEKCRKLNADILVNAQKITHVLVLSQNDQKTIANLRQEFEKAWDIVEQCEKKESKTRSVIANLKTELIRLSGLIQKSGHVSETIGMAKQDAQTSVSELESSIKTNEAEITSLIQNLDEIRKNTNADLLLKKEVSTELAEIEAQIKENLDAHDQIVQTILDSQKEMDFIRNDMIAKEELKNNIRQTKEDTRMKIKLLGENLETEKERLKEEEQDVNHYKMVIHKLNVELQARQKSTSKTEARLKEIVNRKNAVEETVAGLKSEINELDNTRRELEAEAEEANKYKKQIQAENTELTKIFKERSKELDSLNHSYSIIKNKIHDEMVQVDKSSAQIGVINSNLSKEKKVTETVQKQADSAIKDMVVERGLKHKMGVTTNALEGDIESNSVLIKNVSRELIDVTNYNESLKNTVLKGDKELADLHKNSATVEKTITIEKQENQRALNMIVDIQKDNDDRETELKFVKDEMNRMKEEIRKNDVEIARTHQQRLAVDEKNKELEKIVLDYKNKIAEVEEKERQLAIEEEKLNMVWNAAKDSIKDLTRENAALFTTIEQYSRNLSKRNDKAKDVREEEHLERIKMTNGHTKYAEAYQKVENLKGQLAYEVERNGELKSKVRSIARLKFEIMRMEKALLHNQVMSKMLEEEAQTPRNVHRWTLMESTDPERLALVRMKQQLSDLLLQATTKQERLNRIVANKTNSIEKVTKHATQIDLKNYEDEIHYLTDLLRKKNAKIAHFETMLQDEAKSVSEQENEVRNTQFDLRLERTLAIESRQKTLEMVRASTAVNEPLPPLLLKRKETLFIGGGFAVGPGVPVSEAAAHPPASARINRKVNNNLFKPLTPRAPLSPRANTRRAPRPAMTPSITTTHPSAASSRGTLPRLALNA